MSWAQLKKSVLLSCVIIAAAFEVIFAISQFFPFVINNFLSISESQTSCTLALLPSNFTYSLINLSLLPTIKANCSRVFFESNSQTQADEMLCPICPYPNTLTTATMNRKKGRFGILLYKE